MIVRLPLLCYGDRGGAAGTRMRGPSLRLSAPRIEFGPAQLVLTLASVLLALFLYSAGHTIAQNVRVHRQVEQSRVEVYHLRLQKQELQGLRDYMQTNEYVESEARSRFGLVRPGETEVVVDAPQAPLAERQPGQRWWEALFRR